MTVHFEIFWDTSNRTLIYRNNNAQIQFLDDKIGNHITMHWLTKLQNSAPFTILSYQPISLQRIEAHCFIERSRGQHFAVATPCYRVDLSRMTTIFFGSVIMKEMVASFFQNITHCGNNTELAEQNDWNYHVLLSDRKSITTILGTLGGFSRFKQAMSWNRKVKTRLRVLY